MAVQSFVKNDTVDGNIKHKFLFSESGSLPLFGSGTTVISWIRSRYHIESSIRSEIMISDFNIVVTSVMVKPSRWIFRSTMGYQISMSTAIPIV
ncbi:hypothetical protein AYI70_g2819 [Smittium culicis]|uniref:Uncharacterized protein n=1 Tax=Smittium culicis TaxID=133412 RepID=A0A1R1Y6R5_9FUNG|nr:hypothetical protein AYI70_g2819 [Smittium culicis]